jgi:hypothetical protein
MHCGSEWQYWGPIEHTTADWLYEIDHGDYSKRYWQLLHSLAQRDLLEWSAISALISPITLSLPGRESYGRVRARITGCSGMVAPIVGRYVGQQCVYDAAWR